MNNIEPEPINDLVLEDGKENENSAQTLHTCTCSKNYRLQIYSLQIYSLQITRSTDYSCYTLHVHRLQHDYPGYRGTYSRSKQARFI